MCARRRRERGSCFIRSSLLLETWLANPPSVDDVRPEKCAGCGRAHRHDGCVIHGHGRRKRRVLGATKPENEAKVQHVLCRRYRCVLCKCIMWVGPCEVAADFRYTLTTILVALAKWALEQRDAGAVRQEMSPLPAKGFSEPHLWPSLRRWVKGRGALWPMVHVPAQKTLRQTATALLSALSARLARAPPVPEVRHAWDAALVR